MTAAADQSTRKRVLVADPHQVILDTETAILAAEFDVVGRARNGLAVAADYLRASAPPTMSMSSLVIAACLVLL
jgi:hypothetical protein